MQSHLRSIGHPRIIAAASRADSPPADLLNLLSVRQIFPPGGPDGPAERDQLAPAALTCWPGCTPTRPRAGRGHGCGPTWSPAPTARRRWTAARAACAAPADRTLFAVLRSLADVILVGAGTARAEQYQPVRPGEACGRGCGPGGPPMPPIAVVSAGLELDPDSPLLAGRPGRARTIVLTTERRRPAAGTSAGRGAPTVIVAGRDAGRRRLRRSSALAAPRARRGSWPRAARSLLGQIAADGLLDELCLTDQPGAGRRRRGPDRGAGSPTARRAGPA